MSGTTSYPLCVGLRPNVFCSYAWAGTMTATAASPMAE